MSAPRHDAHVHAWLQWLGEYIRRRSRVTDDGCWLWRLCCNSNGTKGVPVMAMPNRGGGPKSVRRIAAMVAGRSPRFGQQKQGVVPMCGNRLCVAPEHMRVLSRAELQRWCVRQGLVPTGATRSARKLAAARSKPHVIASLELARAVRARYAELPNAKAVAAEFGLKHSHAHRIIRHQLWREPSPFAL